jgi:membrane dipeptidase
VPLHLTTFATLSLALAAAPAKRPDPAAIHRSAIIIDTHADTTQRMLDSGFDVGAAPPNDPGHFDLAKARAGNLGAEFFSIWVEPKEHAGRYAHRTLQLIDTVLEQVRRRPDEMVLALSAQDIVNARSGSKKRLAALMGIEGGHSIEADLGLLRTFHRLGVRYMTLTWSNTNEWADAQGDIDDANVKHHGGLTDFGRQVVQEMNRLGMMVDISHVSDEAFRQTLAVTRAPVIASHSSARALCNHGRNLTDEMLKAVAQSGGVVMVNFFSGFLDEEWRQAFSALRPERAKALAALKLSLKDKPPAERDDAMMAFEKEWMAKVKRPPFKILIDHIDHIAKVAGVDHVGLGSDFDGIPSMPEGIDSAADLPKVTAALVERGYDARQIHKILGGNLLRVFREVERVAQRTPGHLVRETR